jgi:hypothetical protein
MNVVIIEVAIDPTQQDEMVAELQQQVVPGTVASPGFVKGVWVQSADLTSGKAVMWFDEAANAKSFADEVKTHGPGNDDDRIRIRNVDLYSIVAEA